jgi:hypothetical protein
VVLKLQQTTTNRFVVEFSTLWSSLANPPRFLPGLKRRTQVRRKVSKTTTHVLFAEEKETPSDAFPSMGRFELMMYARKRKKKKNCVLTIFQKKSMLAASNMAKEVAKVVEFHSLDLEVSQE